MPATQYLYFNNSRIKGEDLPGIYIYIFKPSVASSAVRSKVVALLLF